ncbi:hypothetical protein GDO81_022666 [Engystomops pustulosus]|uniref:Uncharacterized protein n=1 Tax=Engystomops pustulosus TaxID=76066 RepID=A0AAV6ZR82_ENGPU|nr:hypothetical protein GDO81_022666 [Engystomops pustulosus]
MQFLVDRVDGLETVNNTRTYVTQLQDNVRAQAHLMRDMSRHLEDLDNRGRRNNLRVCGVPEPKGPKDVKGILEELFNKVLEELDMHKIKFDRALAQGDPQPGRETSVVWQTIKSKNVLE